MHTAHGSWIPRPCPEAARVAVVLLVLAAMAVIAPGCGNSNRDRATVTGKVTYQGKPLRFGTVIFQPESGQYATGQIQPDSTFEMRTRGEGQGVPIGKNKVRFVCFSGQDPSAKPAPVAAQGEAGILGDPLIPQKYLSCDTSGITVEVKPGTNEPFVFELTDD